jgi:anti-anti-sigma regulatory factor
MSDETTKKLHVCLDKEKKSVFFASVIGRKGANLEVRSSADLRKGMELLMMPVPESWDGEKIEIREIEANTETFNATVSRIEGRGSYQIRTLSFDERNLMDRYRAGKSFIVNLESDIVTAGMVTTIKLEGMINLDTVAQLQSQIRKVPEDQSLILIDLTKLSSLAKSSVGMMCMIFKEELRSHRKFAILAHPNTEIHDALLDSKISNYASIYINRDEAVAALLRQTLD